MSNNPPPKMNFKQRIDSYSQILELFIPPNQELIQVYTVGFIDVDIKFEGLQAQREFGLEDFRDVRLSTTFVDKTLLIKNIFKHQSLLITAPKHFGKTVNIDMISLFLRNDQNNSEIKDLFRGTKIWRDKEFVKDYMHNYPVLYCNFDTGFEVMCEDTLLSCYRQILYGIFIEHDYLKNSPSLSDEERHEFYEYIDENDTLEKLKICNGLKFLSKLLHKHHDKKVLVLIDEYDAIVLNNIFNSNNFTTDISFNVVEEIISFQSNLLRNTIENNNHVQQALITGTLSLDFQDDLSTSSSKIEHIEFMKSKDFIKFYGFTQKEVQSLMNKFKITIDEQKEVEKWYDGYSYPNSNLRVFNPLVISKYFEQKILYEYWVQSFPLKDILLSLMKHKEIQENLVKLVTSREPVKIKIKQVFSMSDIQDIKTFIDKRWSQKTDINIFFQFLLQVGYLTLGKPQPDLPKSVVIVRLPNREIRQELSKMLKQYFSDMLEG